MLLAKHKHKQTHMAHFLALTDMKKVACDWLLFLFMIITLQTRVTIL